MPPRRRLAAWLIGIGALIALATPLLLVLQVPRMAPYLMHVALVLLQLAPYALCAALWLWPWKTGRGTGALVVAALLLLATLAVYGWMLAQPQRTGGDMAGLAFVIIAFAMSAGVAVASLVVALALRLGAR